MGWDDFGVKDNTQDDNKLEIRFDKLGVGQHELRFFQSPIKRWVHWMSHIGQGVDCIGKDCPICAIRKNDPNGEGKKYGAAIRGFAFALKFELDSKNKPTGEAKVVAIDKGNSLWQPLKDVKDMQLDANKLDITEYNVIIKATKSSKGKGFDYTPMAKPASELTEEQLAMIEKVPTYDKFLPMPDRAEVIQMMGGKTRAQIREEKKQNEVVEADVNFEL